jgi:hypothetical protein
MPLFKDQQPITPTPPVVAPMTPNIIIDTTSVYTALQDYDRIIGYIDGSPWQVTYYARAIGNEDLVVNARDINDPTLKQYLKIYTFTLAVTSANGLSIDKTNATGTVAGEANIYPVLTPTVGDVFIGSLQASSWGIFQITNVERLTQFKNTGWRISYQQIGYNTTLDKNTTYDNNVVSEFVFDINAITLGRNPLLTLSQHNQTTSKSKITNSLISLYYQQYYNTLSKTFMVPPQSDVVSDINNTYGASTVTTYDPWLVRFWNIMMDGELLSGKPKPIHYNADSKYQTQSFYTVYDALIKQDPTMLDYCVKRMNSVTSNYFSANYLRHTLKVSDINYVIYPYTNINNNLEFDTTYGDDSDLSQTYVFSKDFYTNSANQTLLETCVNAAIRHDVVLFSDLQTVYNGLANLTVYQRFYYIPFLVVLLQLSV